MAADRGNLSRKMAAIVHADVTGSTALVQLDEALAHERINAAFGRFSQSIEQYGGTVHEIRGDALVAEFPRASDAVCAALAFQESHNEVLGNLDDEITPKIRIGVSLGEVIFADGQVTGAGVVLAQRVEQLAEPGGLCITAAIHEALPRHMPFDRHDLGEQDVKGFEDPVRVYRVALRSEAIVPAPENLHEPRPLNTSGIFAAVIAIVLITAGGLAYWFQPWIPKEEPASAERMAYPLPDKPSIAILPFVDLNDSAEHAYIADGLTQNIIATLGKISRLFVIDRSAISRYNAGSIEAHQVSEELGVRYILKGSVQKSDNRLRVTTTLVDTTTGHHIWSERYDRNIADLFSMQDEITGRIVIELQVSLTEGEQARLKYDATTDFDAWANVARAQKFLDRFAKEDNVKAREFLERAVSLDPQYAVGWSLLAWTHWIDARFGFSESREKSFTKAEELVGRATALDPELGDALSLLGAIHLYKREYDEALVNGRMSIEQSPNNAVIHATVAVTTYSVGDWNETIRLLQRAMRLSPYYPSWYLLYLGRAQTFQGDYREAIATHEKGLARAESPNMQAALHVALAFAHIEAGNDQLAREFMAQAMEALPYYSTSYVKKSHFFKHPDDLERLLEALRKAGMPE
jgi:adenylate cyclase